MKQTYTRDDVLNMKAGEQMDDLVALHLFHWHYRDSYWKPSRRMGNAWELVLYKTFIFRGIEVYTDKGVDCWRVWYQVVPGDISLFIDAPTAPLAICRAALLSIL